MTEPDVPQPDAAQWDVPQPSDIAFDEPLSPELQELLERDSEPPPED